MTTSPAPKPFAVVAWLVAVVVLFWPAAALVARTLTDAAAPAGGFTYSARQFGLLWRSVWLALVAATFCILVAIPAACALVHLHRPTRVGVPRVIVAALAASLLCPPMVYVFAWQRILPANINGYTECVGVWVMWAWPLPALIVAAAWRTAGRSSYEAARLEATPTRAFLHVGLPALRGPIVLCLLILFVIFLGEYTVPHACGLLVYATELLGWSTSSPAAIDTLWPALPVVGLATAGLVAAAIQWRSEERSSRDGTDATTNRATAWPLATIMVLFTGTWILPIGVLAGSISTPAAAGEAIRIYGGDMLGSLGVAALSGILVVVLGLMLTIHSPLRAPALVVAVAFGALPGALIGEALVAAYNYEPFRGLFDHWPMMTLGYASRFAWLGCLAAVSMERRHRRLSDQAFTDGAAPLQQLLHVRLPLWAPSLLCIAAAVTALALGDVATTTLIRVPDFNPITHVIIEKFHRREDDMLISLSIGLVLVALPAAILAATVLAPSKYRQR